MNGRSRQILWGVAGGAVSAVLTLWLRLYMPATDSFADLRDVPTILLALFVGPVPALIAGTLAALTRAAVGLCGGIGSATWFGSSLATFCAMLVAVAARRWIFLRERPSFALGAAVAAMVEMLHMAIVLTVGSGDVSGAFAVIVAAIPFQCGGSAAIVAVVSLAANRRQNGRENLVVSSLVAALVTFVILAYFTMAHEAESVAKGLLPTTGDIHLYPCNLATVLYGMVLSVLAFSFAVYAKRITARRKTEDLSTAADAGRVRIGLRGRFAVSLVVILGVIGGLFDMIVAVDTRMQYERGYAETAVYVAEFLAKYIDGERVIRYRETGLKDDYYNDVHRLLKYVRDQGEVKYLFVAVPDDRGAVYVWGTGVSPITGEPDDLGTREDLLEADELRVYGDVYRQKLARGCFIHRSRTYGHLMSVVAPILGADGRPAALMCVDVSMEAVDERINKVVLSGALMTLVVILMGLAGYYFFVSRFIVSPAERQIAAEKERIHAELNVARKIQAEAMPNVFPAFPGRSDFDIRALMEPAKEVGGDFYDFFFVDDTHLAFVIGDVSDKGVPAALFMMTTKTLVKARACRGGTPGEILRDVNDQLCEGNRSGMFVTVYLAILDLGTGECRSANAGHEHPALRRKGGRFEIVKYAHDPMLGIVPSQSYSERSFRLASGDTLLVYTDGVPEAKNAAGQMYGLPRMTDALDRASGDDAAGLLGSLIADVRAFVGDAFRFDDITILALTYRGSRA